MFVIPVAHELDLKKAAKSVGEKSVAMIRVDEINKVTGYIRGGCSPVGMKKLYPTVFDSRLEAIPAVLVSGGRIGTQIEVAPAALVKAVNGKIAPIIAGLEPGDGPYPALRALTLYRATAGAWGRMRVKAPGSRSDPPQAGVGAETGLQPGPGPGRTAPGRSPQGAKLPGTNLTHTRPKPRTDEPGI